MKENCNLLIKKNKSINCDFSFVKKILIRHELNNTWSLGYAENGIPDCGNGIQIYFEGENINDSVLLKKLEKSILQLYSLQIDLSKASEYHKGKLLFIPNQQGFQFSLDEKYEKYQIIIEDKERSIGEEMFFQHFKGKMEIKKENEYLFYNQNKKTLKLFLRNDGSFEEELLEGDREEQFELSFEIKRKIKDKGFHRKIENKIFFSSNTIKWVRECELIIFERFHDSVFIDPFQLNDISEMEKKIHFESFGEIDLEKPKFLSPQIFFQISKKIESPNQVIEYPIHFRYQNPQSDPYTQVEISSPSFFLNCPNGKKYPLSTNSLPPLTVILPTGVVGHEEFVRVTTFTVPIVASLLILFHIFFYSSQQKSKLK